MQLIVTILSKLIVIIILLLIGLVGNRIKNIYDVKTTEATKEKIVKYACDAVTYFDKDLSNKEQLSKIKEYITELFNDNNISVTDIEKQILIGSYLNVNKSNNTSIINNNQDKSKE